MPITEEAHESLVILTADTVSAFVSTNEIAISDLPELIARTYGAFAQAVAPQAAPEEQPATRAVSIRKSLANPAFILSMIDGKPYRVLTRHLRTNGLTPDEYRKRFDLPKDYPMTSRESFELRSAMMRGLKTAR